MTEQDFLRAILDDPASAPEVWPVLADWLEERGDPRSELVRLQHLDSYRADLSSEQRDERVRQLISSGLNPVVPVLENSIGMTFALILPGRFLMGSPVTERGGWRGDERQREVQIPLSFLLGVMQVTQQNYQQVMRTNPSWFCESGQGAEHVKGLDTSRFPVDSVKWGNANRFCQKLSSWTAEKQAGRSYQLPTESMWEYACRGGARTAFPYWFGSSLHHTQSNFDSNYHRSTPERNPWLRRPTCVGSYPPNGFGIHDMHGNVWEWCQDMYDDTHSSRVLRGGSWDSPGYWCRSASRKSLSNHDDLRMVGFRVLCVRER